MSLKFLSGQGIDGNVGIGTNTPTSTLTVSSDAAGDSSWDKSGILIENTSTTTGEPTLAFRNAGTGGTGANYWFTGLNQSNIYRLAYGTGFVDGNTMLALSSTGALTLNAYTQGFLQTDANGNVSTSGGGTLPGGPYLPLDGGTMTGDLKLNDNVDLYLGTGNDFQAYHDGSNTYLRNLAGDFYIRQDRVDASMIFQCDDGAGGLETYFQLEGASGGASPFTVFPDNSTLAFGTGHDFRLYHNGSNNYQENFTGNMYISNYANDSNIQFSSDNGSGGTAAYILLNGSTGSVILSHYGSTKLETASTGVTVTGDIQIDSALLSNQENTDVDTGTETVASVAIATYTAAFFDFVIKKTTNVRSGTVYACHDGTNVEFTETSTNDLGDTSDVTLSVDISGTNMRLLATVTSNDWSVKSLIRAI